MNGKSEYTLENRKTEKTNKRKTEQNKGKSNLDLEQKKVSPQVRVREYIHFIHHNHPPPSRTFLVS